jgi:hypothetical protein
VGGLECCLADSVAARWVVVFRGEALDIEGWGAPNNGKTRADWSFYDLYWQQMSGAQIQAKATGTMDDERKKKKTIEGVNQRRQQTLWDGGGWSWPKTQAGCGWQRA